MEIERAREIIKQLADGVDPTTGEVLPRESVYNKPEVIRSGWRHPIRSEMPGSLGQI